jgi:hypothetical protein
MMIEAVVRAGRQVSSSGDSSAGQYRFSAGRWLVVGVDPEAVVRTSELLSCDLNPPVTENTR